MKNTSITYKILKFAECDAYRELRYYGKTTVCKITQGLVKALFLLISYSGMAAFFTAVAGSLLYVLGSMLAYLALPVLSALGVEHIFDVTYYQGGLFFILIISAITLFVAVLQTLEGNMKCVPNWMKQSITQTSKEPNKEPHWVGLWLKGIKDKVCYTVKMEK